MMNVLVFILGIIFILLKCEFGNAALTKNNKPHTTSHIFSEYGNLENISIQDILSTGVNRSDQVIEKFLTLIRELASNFDSFLGIQPSVDGFHYPDLKFFEIEFSNKSAIFHNVDASQQFNGFHDYLFFISVECDSSGIGIIRVSLPPIVKIVTDLIIRSQEHDFKVMGNITYEMINTIFIKQSHISNYECNSESNTKHRLFYDDSKVELRTGMEDHRVIYKKLGSFISYIESFLGTHLLKQLNAELLKRNATFSIFSKFMERNQFNGLEPTIISPVVGINNAFSSDLFIAPNISFTKLSALSLYILENLKPEFGQICVLNHNLVIVEGLSNFTSIKTTFSRICNPRPKSKIGKIMILRIKSGILTGKFTWIYRTKANDTEIIRNIEFLFRVNRAEIEIEISIVYLGYEWIPRKKRICDAYKLQDPRIGISLKKIKIQTNLPDTYCENMSKSVQNVFNEYVELAIGKSLKKSITKKINENPSFYFPDVELL